jgi:hypothetical protein
MAAKKTYKKSAKKPSKNSGSGLTTKQVAMFRALMRGDDVGSE